MTVFSIDKLMQETRRLAAEYRQNTGQILPIGAELAKYDAARLLKLIPLQKPIKSVDFIGTSGPLDNQLIQVKSRVIFDEAKSGHRIGQLNLGGGWHFCALVLYEANYQPFAIYLGAQSVIAEAMLQKTNATHNARGLMSLAQYKRVSELIWTIENGLEWDALWSNAS
ncbi:hypothetical protein [Candidatus Berkiella aquae]|uniref:Uncharacterized protein n=1 Tax=Candidatus Berkiella aquae TaxID=295108 RepID=A0A0Q9YWA1_9GAMM|nr:hypothetical protein [Candidatus Berkiella aquae]MCS5711113.1 hypothetical protein [Candidatus Berkiella aquae]